MAGSHLTFGPYHSRAKATIALGRFADAALGPGIGLIWVEKGDAVLLRPPRYGLDGLGITLVAQWTLNPPPVPPPSGFWQNIKAGVEKALALEGEAELRRSQAELAEGRAIDHFVAESWHRIGEYVEGHPVEVGSVAVAGDAIGVLAGVVAFGMVFVAGAPFTAAIAATMLAGGASAVLLAADGQMLAYRVEGREEDAAALENKEWYRTVMKVGPLLLLPDLAMNLPDAVRAARGLDYTRAEREVTETGKDLDRIGDARDAEQEKFEDRQRRRARRHRIGDHLPRRMAAMQRRVARLTDQYVLAQKRVEDAARELRIARIEMWKARSIDAFASSATTYTGTLEAVDLSGHTDDADAHATTPMEERGHKLLRLLSADPSHPSHPSAGRSAGMCAYGDERRFTLPAHLPASAGTLHFRLGVSSKFERAP